MKNNSLLKNVCSNVSGYVISVFIAFLIAPITIRALGDSRYGAWSLVSDLIGYYGLLDLGIRGAVTYHVAKYAVLSQQDEVKETLSSAFWLLTLCGVGAMAVGAGFSIGFPYLFKTDGLDLQEVQHALLIMSGLIGLSLPMNVFGGALVGRQRFDISSGVEIGNRVVTALLVYAVLRRGGGLVDLALVQVAGRALSWTVTLFACRKILGGVFLRPAWFSKERVRSLIGYGSRNSLGQVALMVIYKTDLMVVGMCAGVDRVIFYSLASTLVSYASSLCANITWAFTPRFTELEASNSPEESQRLFFCASRLGGMVVTGLVAGLLVFGKDFIRLWVGEAYVTGPWTDRSDVILTVLILANLPRMLQGVTLQRLYGTGRVRFLMWLNLCEAVANLGLSIVLARRIGTVGVAFGTLIPLVVSQVIVLPFYSCRAFNMAYLEFARKALAVPVLTGILMLGIDLACIRILPPSSWKIFGCEVVAAAVMSLFLCFAIGFNRKEQADLLARFQRSAA